MVATKVANLLVIFEVGLANRAGIVFSSSSEGFRHKVLLVLAGALASCDTPNQMLPLCLYLVELAHAIAYPLVSVGPHHVDKRI